MNKNNCLHNYNLFSTVKSCTFCMHLYISHNSAFAGASDATASGGAIQLNYDGLVKRNVVSLSECMITNNNVYAAGEGGMAFGGAIFTSQLVAPAPSNLVMRVLIQSELTPPRQCSMVVGQSPSESQLLTANLNLVTSSFKPLVARAWSSSSFSSQGQSP